MPRLLERGYRVRVIDRLLYGDAGLRNMLSHPDLELIRADFRDPGALRATTDSVSAVVHLGAIVGDSACDFDPEMTVTTNIQATAIIAETCRARGISRLVFVSTCSVYGAAGRIVGPQSSVALRANQDRVRADPLRQHDAVSCAHHPAARHGLRLFATPAVRSGGQPAGAQAATEGKLAIHSGAQWRPFVHIADISEAIMLALEASLADVGGEIFNIGANEHNYQLRELGSIIRDVIPTTDVAILDKVVDRRNYFVDFAKTRNTLGFQPSRTLRDGVLEIRAALEAGLVTRFRDSRYHNHLHLRDCPIAPCYPEVLATPLAAAHP